MEEIRHTRQSKRFSFGRFIILLLVLLVVAGFGFLVGYATPRRVSLDLLPQKIEDSINSIHPDDTIDENVFDVVWQRIRTEYLYANELPAEDIYYGALKGVVAGLGDPYSLFLDPEQTEEFTNDLEGTFEGIGAEIGIKNDRLTIITPLAGSPAERAGLQPGDVVTYIDGESSDRLELDEAVAKIRGEQGTIVTLTIVRGDGEPFDVAVERNTIQLASVSYEIRDEIAIITLTTFNEETLTELDGAMQEIVLASPKGVILDLRNNPGGLLNVSIDVASEFLPRDSLVVVERDANGVEVERTTKRQSKLENTPMVILVNGGSASAAEIVAGAFQDLGRATVIGEKTFGKGTVQTFETLADGSSLKLTVSEWLTPNGRSFTGNGIEPDILVELTEEDYNNDRDPQLERAIEELR